MRADDYPSRKKLKLKVPVAKEWDEQRTLFDWALRARSQYPELDMLVGSMNGLRVSNPRIIVQAKLCGLKPGFPDVQLLVARGGCHGLLMELKRKTGGVLSPEQLEWRDRLHRNGYAWACCKGFDEAREVILDYLKSVED